jgi:hypothetical protein
MTTNYKKLDYVLNFIPTSLQEDQKDSEQWLSWALQYLRKVNSDDRFVTDIAVLELDKHKACLPKGLKKIKAISMMPQEIEDSFRASSYNSYLDVGPETVLWQGEVSEQNDAEVAPTLYYQLYLQALNSMNTWRPMKYVGAINNKDYFTTECWKHINNENCSNCYNEFSITTDGCLMTSIEEGMICVMYTSEAKDDKNNFLAPEEPLELWQALAHYAISQYWLNKTGFITFAADAHKLYESHLRTAGFYLKEAKSILRQKSFSYRLHYAMTFDESEILRIPAVWKNK